LPTPRFEKAHFFLGRNKVVEAEAIQKGKPELNQCGKERRKKGVEAKGGKKGVEASGKFPHESEVGRGVPPATPMARSTKPYTLST
jgi:hypothetical protein